MDEALRRFSVGMLNYMRTPLKDHGVYLTAWNMAAPIIFPMPSKCFPLSGSGLVKRSTTLSVLARLLVQNVPNLKEAVRQFGKLFSSCF